MKRFFILLTAISSFACSTIEERKQELAFQDLAETVREEPENFEARLALGDGLASRGYSEAAFSVWEEAGKQRPDDLRFLRRIADHQFAIGAERQAIASYERLLDLSKDSPKADPSSYYRMAWAHLNIGEWEKGLARFEQFTTANLWDPAGFVGLGYAQMKLSEQPEKGKLLDDAVNSFNKALALNLNSFEARFNLATALEKKGNSVAAQAEYERILESRPDEAVVLENLAMIHWKAGRNSLASGFFQRALAQEKDKQVREEIETKLAELKNK